LETIELGIPRGEKQQLFVDLLNAALRERGAYFSMLSSSGNHFEDGSFESILTLGTPDRTGTETVTWRLTKASDGSLSSITVEAQGPRANEAETEAGKVVHRSLVLTLSEPTQRYFHRVDFYFVGPRLDGEYWLPGFRLAPGDPDESQHDIFSERVVYIDQEVSGVDEMHARVIANERARRHAARLSFLMNIGLTRPTGPHRIWVLSDDEGPRSGCERRFRGFVPSTQATRMPKKGTTERLGKRGRPILNPYGYAGETVTIPLEARAILRGLERLPANLREAFDKCARLYQVALIVGRQLPSVGLAYRVAAVDALAQGAGATRDFREFVRSNIDLDAGLETLLNTLYGEVRSAHFHGGAFPLGEFTPQRSFDPLMDQAWVRQQEIGYQGSHLLRSTVLAWLSRTLRVPLRDPADPAMAK
jgi:hypothetical protein